MRTDSSLWFEAAARLGITLRRVGSTLRGRCPFHRGTNDTALSITPEEGVFHCFNCGEGGSYASFARRAGVDVGAIEPSSLAIPTTPTPERRTITPIGPLDPAHAYFAERGIHAATARFFGAGYFDGGGAFGERIIVPLYDHAGRFVGHIGRAIDDREPRWLIQRGVTKSTMLFNRHRVTRSGARDVVLVEGVFDAFALHQVGIANVVASLGCEVSKRQRELLSVFRRVFILFDADDAGRVASDVLRRALHPRATELLLPPSDPCTVKGALLTRIVRDALLSSSRPRESPESTASESV
jgi:DNA primase